MRSGNLITANGTAALEFAKEVALALNIAPEQNILAFYDFHKLGYYDAKMPELAWTDYFQRRSSK